MVFGDGVVGVWSDNEKRSLVNGTSTLIKEVPESSRAPSNVRTQLEDDHLWIRKWALVKYQICRHLNFGLPSLHNCDKVASVWYSCYSSPKGLRPVVTDPAYKDLGTFHYILTSKMQNKLKNQLFWYPLEKWGCRANHLPQNQRNRQENTKQQQQQHNNNLPEQKPINRNLCKN